MTVKLYTCTADKLKADKSGSLTQLAEVSGVNIYGDFNILKPQIKIDANSNSLTANYVYIAELGRYYFVTDKTGLTATHVILSLENDRRYNFLSVVQNSDVTATRCNMYNKNIPETMALNVPQEKITYRKLSSALTGENYILVVGG